MGVLAGTADGGFSDSVLFRQALGSVAGWFPIILITNLCVLVYALGILNLFLRALIPPSQSQPEFVRAQVARLLARRSECTLS